MNIYVAAPSSHWDMAAQAMEVIRKAGHTIAFDWTRAFSGGYQEEELQDGDLVSERCLRAINRAHLVVLVVPMGSTSSGMWVELGYAIAAQKQILACIISPNEDSPDYAAEREWEKQAIFINHKAIQWKVWESKADRLLPHIEFAVKEAQKR